MQYKVTHTYPGANLVMPVNLTVPTCELTTTLSPTYKQCYIYSNHSNTAPVLPEEVTNVIYGVAKSLQTIN